MRKVENKPCFVGIDVSKATLDICLLPTGKRFQVENKGDFSHLVNRLKKAEPELVVLEPTGGYEKGILSALIEAEIPVSRQHALRIHHHAKSRGKRAKSDPIDSETIAHYAQCYSKEIEPMTHLPQEELRQLVDHRETLVRMRASEKTRLQGPGVCEVVKVSCQRHLTQLDEEIALVEKAINEQLERQEGLSEKKALLLSVPGIGETTANVVLSSLPELGKVTHKQIASLVGVAPFVHQSGKYRGEQHIGGGRPVIRCVLYMATLAAIRHNPVLAGFYQQLKQRGKKSKVAIVACMHKLLRIMNAMMAKGEAFKTA